MIRATFTFLSLYEQRYFLNFDTVTFPKYSRIHFLVKLKNIENREIDGINFFAVFQFEKIQFKECPGKINVLKFNQIWISTVFRKVRLSSDIHRYQPPYTHNEINLRYSEIVH